MSARTPGQREEIAKESCSVPDFVADLAEEVGVTGWQGVLFTVFASSLIGTLVGLPWAYLNKGPEGTLKAAIPFGPFLALGALIYVLWGAYLIDWYFGFLG